MTRHCSICKIKLSFFYRKHICKDCQSTKYNPYLIGDNISKLPDLINEELTKLAQFGYMDCLHLYNLLFKFYVKNQRLSANQIESLRKISNVWSIEDRTLVYEERNKQEEIRNREIQKLKDIKDIIKKSNILPKINEDYFDQLKFSLSKNEKYFISGNTNYHQRQILSSYQSFGERITKKGSKLKSKGDFVMSWDKFYYIPKFDGNLITIDLSKIIKYDIDGNFLRIRKEGREKAYLFQMNSYLLEICKMGLDFLSKRKYH